MKSGHPRGQLTERPDEHEKEDEKHVRCHQERSGTEDGTVGTLVRTADMAHAQVVKTLSAEERLVETLCIEVREKLQVRAEKLNQGDLPAPPPHVCCAHRKQSGRGSSVWKLPMGSELTGSVVVVNTNGNVTSQVGHRVPALNGKGHTRIT